MDGSELKIERWDKNHDRWSELMALQGIDNLDLESKAEPWHQGIYTLVALYEKGIVGVLRFWTQEIGVDEEKPPFLVGGKPAVEAKVVTFHVFEAHRRQGIGRELQLAAVRWARELDCYQVRSRSAYHRKGNHALKASLGFGISPGRNTTDGPVATAFFVLPLRLSTQRLVDTLPPLDAHAHLDPDRTSDELAGTGAVLAMTLSLDEAARALDRREPTITWGVGCHPRDRKAQEAFDAARFGALVERAAIVGEIGLDTESRVPLEIQLQTFRQALAVVAELPRLVSIHSYRATGLVLEELRRRPVAVPVLHWWTGSAAETQEAVALGCYFSIHSAVARHSKFRTRVPPERVLIESDHSYIDPLLAIPCRVEWVEHLVGQQLKLGVEEVRRLAWRNLATILRETGTMELLPQPFATILTEVSPDIVRE